MRRPNKSTVPWTTLEPLGIYLNDHLAGASAGLALSKRLAARHGGSWDHDCAQWPTRSPRTEPR